MDAGRPERHVFLFARHLVAERRAAFLDRTRRRRRRRADAFAARLSGKNFRRWIAYRLSHEQFLGRRAPQLSRRAEPAHLDRRSEELRFGFAALD